MRGARPPRPRAPRSTLRGARRGRTLALTGLSLAALAAPASSQTREPTLDGWFPTRANFPALRAAAREPGVRGSFLFTDRPSLDGPEARDFEGRNVEAEVALGLLVPVFGVATDRGGADPPAAGARPADDRPSFQIGFEVGVFSRFFMETEEKDLIGTDFRVGIPLSVALDGWAARLEARHISAHAGDDYLSRFRQEPEKVGYDGFELTLARRFGAARLYAGGEMNWEKEEIVERSAARLGLELDPTLDGPIAGPRPFVAFDLRMAENTERVEGTGIAGIVVPAGSFRLRFEAQGHFGPSGLGQLRLDDEESVGVGLRIETGRSPVP